MSFSKVSCRRNAAVFTAAPSGPKSWWLHTPLNLRGCPFSEKPTPFSNLKDRMPNVVLNASFSTSPAYSFDEAVYSTGVSGLHSRGCGTVRFCSNCSPSAASVRAGR